MKITKAKAARSKAPGNRHAQKHKLTHLYHPTENA